ncbi:MAG: TonB-dependent receptor [Bacteroidaceae bacterium]|nr:TonB-dependent receptor [Bacteroidaceae bacterium]
MKKEKRSSILRAVCLALGLMISSSLIVQAQDMVTAVGEDGLEKTVSYDVEKFTDIRDKKLEDVMKKMPGLSAMSWDGSTSFMYNGMFVEKIYVNGLDMLEGNYAPVYNMKPEDVERLEITENHVSIKVMKGVQYSDNAAINVVLKDHAQSKWTGSIKGGLGVTPLLVNADVNALNIGQKMQTTVLFKADNTGLDFSGALNGFGGNDWDDGGNGSYDYSIKEFLSVNPSLAPLSSERTRDNRSGIANIGSTFKLNDDYQLNVQLTYHTDRLTASSFDETTYYLSEGETVVDVVGESAKSKQQDIQTDFTLLANTDTKYLRNQLSFATRWNDVNKENTGERANDQLVSTTPLLLKNDFLYKTHLGRNILSVSSQAGLYLHPQDLDVKREEYPFMQKVKANSYFANLGLSYDIKLNDKLSLNLNGGVSENLRGLKVKRSDLPGLDSPDIKAHIGIFNAHTEAKLTFITDKLQAELSMPVKYGDYSVEDQLEDTKMSKSKFYLEPSLNIKYEVSSNLSLSLEAELEADEVNRKNLYPGMIFQNFRTASKGLPAMKNETGGSIEVNVSYKHPASSFFVNGSIEHRWEKDPFVSDKSFTDLFIINGRHILPSTSSDTEIRGDISKGINFMKGKIGMEVNYERGTSKIARNDQFIPLTSTEWMLSPYVNGRLTQWLNAVYRLDFNMSNVKMKDEDTSSKSKGYTQSLELIFSPSSKLNFSVLGEHYYTEFSDDVSKHLILADVKAEYNINDKWQLILSAKNILNQDTYNYTMVDSRDFTKSYTSYKIRPRNILLSLYYKF